MLLMMIMVLIIFEVEMMIKIFQQSREFESLFNQGEQANERKPDVIKRDEYYQCSLNEG